MSEEQKLTCISCPVGCRMTVTIEDGKVLSVEGFSCKRGDTYARQESVRPMRMVTAVAPVKGCAVPLSVKTLQPVPKDSIAACMAEINKLDLKLPIRMGEVILKDIAGTGVSLVATRTLV